MKLFAALYCFLLIGIANPALALQGSDCSARSAQLKQSERKDFMQSCLAQAKEPSNVREEERKHKNAVCEQNAKNKKLQENDKASYLSNCMNKNEAAAAASIHAKNITAPSHKPASTKDSRVTKQKGITRKQALKLQKGQKNGTGKNSIQSGKTSGPMESN